jgi:hypothetical protein
MKKFILVNKADHKVIYSGQIFETESDSPVGLLGGFGQRDWYWVDITNTNPSNIENGRFIKTIRIPPEGEIIDPNAENVVVSQEGTWQ